MRLYEVMVEWINFHSITVSAPTVLNYSRSINVLKNRIGEMDIEDITKNTIQELFVDFYNIGLSENTIINYSKPIRQALEYAVNKGYIEESPYKDIVMPKTEREEINPFTEEEVKKLLSADMPIWFSDAVQIAFRTGMRKGEIFALMKQDIDLKNAFLTIRYTQSKTKEGYILKKPKTKASRRRISLDKTTLDILYRRYLKDNTDFIFTYSNGEMLIPTGINAMLDRKCKAAGIQKHRFHDLRHGHATYLLKNNVHPKIVQERLGHSSIKITLDTYSHLIQGLQNPAIEIINKLEF